MLTRRGHSFRLRPLAAAALHSQPKRIAIVATIYRYLSHAQHMGDRFLVGYPYGGAWHKPNMKVVSLYVDQKPEGDLSGERARNSVSRFTRRSPKLCAAAGRNWRWTRC